MSLSFQNLRDEGTTAYAQLQQLAKIIESVNELNYPDIYKKAKMFAPDKQLVPVVKTWGLGLKQSDSYVAFDGRYFGDFEVHHHNFMPTNLYSRSIATIHDGGEVALRSLVGYRGNNNIQLSGRKLLHSGFGTGISLSHSGNQPEHELTVVFLGFKLEDAPAPHLYRIDWYNKTGSAFRFTTGETPHTGTEGYSQFAIGTKITVRLVNGGPYKIDGQVYTDAEPYSFFLTESVTLTVDSAVNTANFEETEVSSFLLVSVDGLDWAPLPSTFEYTNSYRIKAAGALAGFDPHLSYTADGVPHYLVEPQPYLEVALGHPLFAKTSKVYVATSQALEVSLKLPALVNSGSSPITDFKLSLLVGYYYNSFTVIPYESTLDVIPCYGNKYMLRLSTPSRPFTANAVINGLSYVITSDKHDDSGSAFGYYADFLIPLSDTINITSLTVLNP